MESHDRGHFRGATVLVVQIAVTILDCGVVERYDFSGCGETNRGDNISVNHGINTNHKQKTR